MLVRCEWKFEHSRISVIDWALFRLFLDCARTTDKVPKTAENFLHLCIGDKGKGKTTGKPLHFKGTKFHRYAQVDVWTC